MGVGERNYERLGREATAMSRLLCTSNYPTAFESAPYQVWPCELRYVLACISKIAVTPLRPSHRKHRSRVPLHSRCIHVHFTSATQAACCSMRSATEFQTGAAEEEHSTVSSLARSVRAVWWCMAARCSTALQPVPILRLHLVARHSNT